VNDAILDILVDDRRDGDRPDRAGGARRLQRRHAVMRRDPGRFAGTDRGMHAPDRFRPLAGQGSRHQLQQSRQRDLAVTQRSQGDLDAGLLYHPLFHIELRIGARVGHPLAGVRDLHELAGATWLATTAPGNKSDRLTHSMKAAGLPPPVFAAHCGSIDRLIRVVQSSDMLLQMPSTTLRPLVESGKLSEVYLNKRLATLRVGLYSRADSPPTREAQVAARVITAIARRYATSGALRATAPLGRG
jgi:DNA-binding transcriptional LysR family regulator